MSQIWHLNYMLMTSYWEEKLQMSARKIYDWKALCMLTECFSTTSLSFCLLFFKKADWRTRGTFDICVWFSAPGHELKTKQILLQRFVKCADFQWCFCSYLFSDSLLAKIANGLYLSTSGELVCVIFTIFLQIYLLCVEKKKTKCLS